MTSIQHYLGCVLTLALLTPVIELWAQDEQTLVRPVSIGEDPPKSQENLSTGGTTRSPEMDAKHETQTSNTRVDQSGLKSWLCSLFEVNCANLSSALVVRKPGESSFGATLARFDQKDKTEEMLWSCERCASPIVLNQSHIAVIKQDGIYDYDINNKKARLIVQDGTQEIPGLESLLGLSKEQDWIVVAIRLDEESDCQKIKRYSVVLVEINSGKVRKPEDQPEACLELSLLLEERFKRNQISGDQVLLQENGKKRKILLHKVGSKSTAPLLMPKPLAEDGGDRFDPAWAGPGKIVYIKK